MSEWRRLVLPAEGITVSFGRDQVIFLRPGRRVNVARACLGEPPYLCSSPCL